MKSWQKLLLAVICIFVLVVNYMLSKPMIAAIKVSTQQALVNRTIVIDPGHGGRDNGAAVDNVKEDVLNLEVAMSLKKIIEQAGGTVILIRDDDYDLSSENATNHKREDLKKRVEIMDEDNVDLFVSIHMNKYGSPSVSGAQVFYQPSHEYSKLLASKIQDKMNDLLRKKKFPTVGNYYILNETTKPGVLVECGFLSNSEERTLLQSSEYQTKLAYAVYEGIIAYFREAIIL